MSKSKTAFKGSMHHSHSFPTSNSCKNSWTATSPKYVSLRDMMPRSSTAFYGRSFTFSGIDKSNYEGIIQPPSPSPILLKRSPSEKFLPLAMLEYFLEELKRPLSNCLRIINRKFIAKISHGIGKIFAAIRDG
ncbi:hypothetical protein ACH5RR_009660 [Cinchona calisaya]|uniref:Uncharacterized protein n=1 Tax=Cinchona calisaya TaxID=153742 RepID=A0ABD3AFM6_9GENT